MGNAKIHFWSTVWDYVVMSFGALIYCMAWTSFMIPHNIASGGLTGAVTILQYATGIPMSYSYLVLNALLLLLSFIILGKSFGIKTIYVIILSTLLFKYLPLLTGLESTPGKFLYISEEVLVPIIGGLLEAIGIALILQRGGSTGGTDVVVMVANKYWPVSPGKVYLITDVVIIATILLLPGEGQFQKMIYGYIDMITFSFMVDFVLLGRKTSVQVLVFSEKYSQIADRIMTDMERGVTALQAVGWYTKKQKEVLLILVRKYELHDITKMIKSIDPKAFVSVSPASSVYGEGFEEIKTGIERKKKATIVENE